MARRKCLQLCLPAVMLAMCITLLIIIYEVDVYPTKKISVLKIIDGYRKKSEVKIKRKHSKKHALTLATSSSPSTFGEYIEVIFILL